MSSSFWNKIFPQKKIKENSIIKKGAYNYILEYYKSCKNCLRSDNTKRIYYWSINKPFFIYTNLPKESHGFETDRKMLIELYKIKKPCEYCGHVGIFDVWGTTVDGISYNYPLTSNHPFVEIKVVKENGVLHPTITPYGLVTMMNLEDFFEGLLKIVNGYPSEFYIPHNNGSFKCVLFFDSNHFSNYFHQLKFVGIGKSELWDCLIELKKSVLKE